MSTLTSRPIRLAAAAAVGLLVILGAPAASAHTQLASSDPADGATLTTPPSSVTFTFDEDLLPGTDTVSINDAAGNVLVSTDVDASGPTISAPWPAAASSGTFQVADRVVSDDGHPVTGAITITIAADGSSAPTASSEPEPRGIAAGLVVVIALAVLVLIVAVAITLVRRQRRL